MKVEAEELINYHCPRWNELPEIELYIDQVICVLQSNLSIFSKEENSPVITPNMINNYVKQEVLKPPVKKKYNKSNKKIKNEIEDVKYVIQKTYIENISITAKMGTKNPTTTAILVGISSSVLAIILARKVKYSKYSIEPIYQDKNYIYLSINCIFKIKLVHIINIIKKLRKEYQ